MTTPAHCTRTWATAGDCPANDDGTHHCAANEGYHHVQHVCDCGNVEPPAAVQATPDPTPTPAPAGLSAAQEIRLRVLEVHKHLSGGLTTRDEDAAWVERGDDETPDTLRLRDAESRVEGLTLALAAWKQRCEQADCPHPALHQEPGVKRLYEAAGEANAAAARAEARADLAESDRDDYAARLKAMDKSWAVVARQCDEHAARADLAEARLGHIADALRVFAGQPPAAFINAVQECLAWTSEDTATAGADASLPNVVVSDAVPPDMVLLVPHLERDPQETDEEYAQRINAETRVIRNVGAGAATGDGDG